MLKQSRKYTGRDGVDQPPSGGCVLKLRIFHPLQLLHQSAAFGRLCVETDLGGYGDVLELSAAFGRLCVETAKLWFCSDPNTRSAAFGRLCVETSAASAAPTVICSAAFGRLCVETDSLSHALCG